MEFTVTDAWRWAFPGAVVGALVMQGVANPPHHPPMEEHVQRVEAAIRARFAGARAADLADLPQLLAYRAYYKRFGKTYHVQLQLESVVIKGKPLARPGALVEAMFAAELHNLLLTAGHDLDVLAGAVTVDISRGGERYVGIGGQEQVLKPGDMMMQDGRGIISSILYGPDRRTRLTAETRRSLFTVYAPAGIGAAAVRQHLEEIAANVRLIAPEAVTVSLETHTA